MTALRIVPPPVTTAQVLREAFKARDEAADQLRQIDAIIAAELKVYAAESGRKFVRAESARQELSNALLEDLQDRSVSHFPRVDALRRESGK